MNLPLVDRAVLVRVAQIAQRTGTHDSKTDQTAQSDQHSETVEEFGALLGPEATSSLPELTSGTVQRSDFRRTFASHANRRAVHVAGERPTP
jgi:hypothetical protein